MTFAQVVPDNPHGAVADIDSITAVLLDKGKWIDVGSGSFSIQPFQLVFRGDTGTEVLTDGPGFFFFDGDGDAGSGPIASLRAIRCEG